jgi:hypothetical protein
MKPRTVYRQSVTASDCTTLQFSPIFFFKIGNADPISLLLPRGKATGLVTNTRVTHATPAALFAHSPSRYWEDDGKVTPNARSTCKDIARQLVEEEPGRHINVSA